MSTYDPNGGRPKVVYLAGLYGDSSGYLAIDANINRARIMAAWCANHGIGFICPHMNTAHFEVITPDVPVDFWYDMDLQIMRGADAMYLLDGWESSRGVAKELTEWTATGKPVFETHEMDELLAWAKSVQPVSP